MVALRMPLHPLLAATLLGACGSSGGGERDTSIDGSADSPAETSSDSSDDRARDVDLGLDGSRIEETCRAGCAANADAPAEALAYCTEESCVEDCVATTSELSDECVACLAEGFHREAGCTPIDCSCLRGEPDPDACETECAGTPGAAGSRCWRDEQCESGLCYGPYNGGVSGPKTCQDSCIVTDDATFSCKNDGHCCTGRCCRGCASYGLCIGR